MASHSSVTRVSSGSMDKGMSYCDWPSLVHSLPCISIALVHSLNKAQDTLHPSYLSLSKDESVLVAASYATKDVTLAISRLDSFRDMWADALFRPT